MGGLHGRCALLSSRCCQTNPMEWTEVLQELVPIGPADLEEFKACQPH